MTNESEGSHDDVVEALPLGRTLATLSTFEGRFWEDVWHGHHRPLRLALLFSLISMFTAWVEVLGSWSYQTNSFYLRPLRPTELQDIRRSHKACLDSLCREARDISFTCYIDDNGDAKLDRSSIEGEGIPLTTECRDALEVVFGSVDNLFGNNKHVSTDGIDSSNKTPWLFRLRQDMHDEAAVAILSDSCELVVELDPSLWSPAKFRKRPSDTGNLIPKEASTITLMKKSPLRQSTFEPAKKLCYDAMPEEWQKHVPTGIEFYDWILKYHRIFVMVALVPTEIVSESITNLVLLFGFVLLRALILSYAVSWPTTTRGGKNISVWTISKALLLIGLVVEFFAEPHSRVLLCGLILALAALHYNGKKAAAEWAFLMFVAFAPSSTFEDFVNPIVALLSRIDGLHIIRATIGIMAWMLPGTGWNKLVALMAIYKAFPRSMSKVKMD